jgi:hypothetical protein
MRETFPIIAPGATAMWVVIAVCLALLAGLVLMAMTALAFRSDSVVVSTDGLRLRVPLYGRLVPLSSLELTSAHPVDLVKGGEFSMSWRTNGIGLPGYSVGWFKLSNGGKALAAVTDRHHVAWIPTRDGYSLLVSVADPQALIDALRREAPAS